MLTKRCPSCNTWIWDGGFVCSQCGFVFDRLNRYARVTTVVEMVLLGCAIAVIIYFQVVAKRIDISITLLGFALMFYVLNSLARLLKPLRGKILARVGLLGAVVCGLALFAAMLVR